MKPEDLSRRSSAEPDRYHRFVRWSDEDQCFIGYCPNLYFGGVCHGTHEEDTYAELCAIVRDEIAHRSAKGDSLPEPSLVSA